MLSNRVKSINESATLAMASKAKELSSQGVDVINMSLGEPDFSAPEFLKEAAKKAIDDNFSSYSPVPGFQELRVAISEKLKRDNDLSYEPTQIVVSNGAKQSVANMILSLVNPGDEVVLPAPYWVSYFDVIKFAGGEPIVIETNTESDFKITPDQLIRSFTAKTKLFLFSNPCNPSGTVYTKEELEALADVFESYPEITLVSDEIYEYITFDKPHYSLGAIDKINNRVITINGLSKAFAVTGWRLGYLAAPLEIAKACSKIQSQFTSGANSIAQIAAIAALNEGKESVEYMREAFHKRRDLLISEIKKKLPKVKTNTPQGAFYLFPDISYYFGKGGIENSYDLSMYLLNEAHVAMTPGEAFGCHKNIRMSYALGEDKIVEAIERLEKALSKL